MAQVALRGKWFVIRERCRRACLESPEAIVQAFPSLSLEQVYGGITFYLAHRAEIDAYLEKAEARFKELAMASRNANPFVRRQLDFPADDN